MARSHSARSRRKFATLKKPTAALAAATLAMVIVSAIGTRPAAAQERPAAAPETAPAPVTSGYDKGFYIKADRFAIHFGTRLQLLYQYTDPDTLIYDSLLQDTEDTKPLNELFVRRFKFYMTGFAWNPALKYKVQFDVVPFKVGGGSGGGNIRLEEAYLDVTYKPWTQVRLGQFKLPFGYEKMTSSGKLDLVDRSIVHSFFGIEQEPGVNLYGQSFGKKFRYDVAVTTGVADQKGFNTANDVAADGKSDFRYSGRVTWEPLAPYTWEQGAVSSPEEAQLTLQLGFQSNRNTVPQDNDPFLPSGAILPFGPSELGAPSPTFTPATTASIARWSGVSQSRKPYDRNEVEGVAAFKYKRFYVEGQGIVGSVSPDTKWLQGANADLQDLTYDNSGYRLQAGFMLIPTRLELAGRWAQVDRKAEAKFFDTPDVKEEIEIEEYRAGVNWYFSRHDWKWQFDIGKVSTTRSLDGTKLVVPDPEANPNKLIQDNSRSDMVFRTQIQFMF